MQKLTQRTEAVIDLQALAHNIRNVRQRLAPGVGLMAVLKGDAYGHGIPGVYATFRQCGVDGYAVATWEEGAALRSVGAVEPILVLGDTWDAQLENLLKYSLTPAIFSLETARKLDLLAGWSETVQPIHIKIDTGMSRIGFPAGEEAVAPIQEIAAMKHLKITGAFTHFSRADEPFADCTAAQLRKFLDTVACLERAGISIPLRHAANSPAVLLHPQTQLDAVRPGDILFGLCPIDADRWAKEDFRQVLRWYSYVALVKQVPPGTAVGYGGTFVARRPTTIATIPVGFADGYSRGLSNRGKVRIRGQEAPILGRVCMDQFMVDVTDIPGVARGDTVTLLDEDLSILWMAELLGVNVDEIVCGISKRVPRVYR